jgi:lysophospholipase L1-like esterase
MKLAVLFALSAALLSGRAFAQVPQPQTTPDLAAHMSQLMESTAVAVPDLIRASAPIRQLAAGAVSGLRANPGNASLSYRFINIAKAYLALADSFPVTDIPPAATAQFGELRQDVTRFERRFEADLAAQGQATAETEADPDNLRRYAEANSKLLPLGTLPRVVFLGDSITESWHLNEYFPGRDFLNRGIGGQTSRQMLGRFPQDVAGVHPKAMVILAGTDDIAHGVSPHAIEDTFTMFGDLAKAHGIKPVFASILPVSDYHAAEDPRFEMTKAHPLAVIREINGWLKNYCRKEQFVFLDYYAVLADTQGQMPVDLADDGLYPNAKGYRIMAPAALDAITRALAPGTPPPPDTQSRRRFTLPGAAKKSEGPTP